MKQNKFNFPNSRACIAVLLLCLAVSSAYAQTVQWPTHSDQYWYRSASGSDPIQGLNTAAIVYNPYPNTKAIFASVYYDGTTNPTIHAMDPAVGSGTASYGGAVHGTPDVIIGNTTGILGTICTTCNPLTDYILAAAYYNGNTVEVDYYLIHDDGVSTFTMSPNPVTTQTITATNTRTVHIDVIADAGNTSSTGFPFCNQFAIAWDDFSSGGPFVYTALGDLNAGTVSAPSIKNLTTGGSTGYAPDVAAILYSNPTPDAVALVTYVDGSTNDDLYLASWDFPGTAYVFSTITLDAGSTTSAISMPRIDAIDDYTANSFSSITTAVYKVVAQVDSNTTGIQKVRTYDNLQTGWPSSCVINITAVPTYTVYPTTGYNNYAPTVAYNQDYIVSHFMEYNGATGGDILFMEPTEIGSPTVLLGNDYYWVDSTSNPSSTPPVPPTAINAYSTFANAVCTPANNGGFTSLFAWAQLDGAVSSQTYDVYYKIPLPGYAFKPAPGAVANIKGIDGWQVYPNPATNELTVSAATAGAGMEYRITDMAGRILLQGNMPGKSTEIDVSMLTAGAYLLKIYGSENTGQTMFVKN